MTLNLNTIIPAVLLLYFLYTIFSGVFFKRDRSPNILLNSLAAFCVLVGAIGFFGSAIVAFGGFGSLQHIEFPVGNAEEALPLNERALVVPLTQYGRVQIYDESLSFKDGWNIDAAGGTFRVYPLSSDSFTIYTARGNQKYTYSLGGELLSSESYSQRYPGIYPESTDIFIPTPIYLLAFIHPFYSWLLIIAGGLIALISEKYAGKPNN